MAPCNERWRSGFTVDDGTDPLPQPLARRQIVSLSLEGSGVAEVSAAVVCSESKVYRILARVLQLLERMNAAEA
jgi:hypothetical protein